MIDELKMILEQLQRVPDVALWILGGFLLYKLVAMLSMTGSVVFVIKLLCGTALKWGEKPRLVSYDNILIGEDAHEDLKRLLKSIRQFSAYVHASDIRKLEMAWSEFSTKERK